MSPATQIIFGLKEITIEIELVVGRYNDPVSASVMDHHPVAIALLNQYFYGDGDIDNYFQGIFLPSDVKTQLIQTVFSKINQQLQNGFSILFPYRQYSYVLVGESVLVTESLHSSMSLEVVTVRNVAQGIELVLNDKAGILYDNLPESLQRTTELTTYINCPHNALSAVKTDLEPIDDSNDYVPERLRHR